MASITSGTTTNRDLLKKQQVTFNMLVEQNTDLEELIRELLEAIKEITER